MSAPRHRASCASAVVALLAALALAGPAAARTDTISTVAGTGANGFSGDGGPATAAQVGVPVEVERTADGGYLVVTQGTFRVRRVAPDGTIATIAGNGVSSFAGDGGPATAASLNTPNGLAVRPDSGVLIADSGNHRVRLVAPDGTITTVAGNGVAGFGGDNGPATSAQLNFPSGVAVTPDGGFLVVDNDNNRVRRVGPEGTIPPSPATAWRARGAMGAWAPARA